MKPATTNLRLLQTDASSASAVGVSAQIDCIKKDANSGCPTKEEAIKFNKPDCGSADQPTCNPSNGKLLALLSILVVLLF